MIALLLDCPNLIHRAFHGYAKRYHPTSPERKAGCLYGLLRDVAELTERFRADRVVFCFDEGTPLRRKVYPTYKTKSHPNWSSPYQVPQVRDRTEANGHIVFLRDVVLPRLKIGPVLHASGFEADDVIASITKRESHGDLVMVSSDQDLYQLLDPHCCLYKPIKKVVYRSEDFARDWSGIHPGDWCKVKAIAGCHSDGIPGVGVGDVLAARYVAGTLTSNKGGKQAFPHKVKLIESDVAQETIARNLQIITLPYEGCPAFDLDGAELHWPGWPKLCKLSGLEGLAAFPSISSRRMRRG